ncbi:MAG: NlpC/P60 family protein [Actinobacteria bacterium]|nr:NlpC/P60 family protein [Actinomycetota bacterium]
MSKALSRLFIVVALLGGLLGLSSTPAYATYPDVPSLFWAKTAIDYVATDHDWMADFGENFLPEAVETKRRFASALVKAFDPDGVIDPTITFPDVPTTDPFYRYANIAVKHGWMTRLDTGHFKPANGVTTTMVHRGLVLALGLDEEVAGINALHLADGTPISVDPIRAPYLILGMQLSFRVNHGTETNDVMPGTVLHRDEVAWSLWKAATVQSWQLTNLIPYRTITLPAMDALHEQMVEFGLKYVGYPYIYGGEWYMKTGTAYCCGTQPKGGFDCSGLMWWTVKSPAGGYSNATLRGYTGWSLPERASASMASVGAHITYANTLPGDLMFHDSTGAPGTVSHVNLYLGNGWALDSSSGRGGVSIIKVDSGYYYDQFMWSRRLSPGTATASSSPRQDALDP